MLFYLLSAIIFTIVASAAPTSAPALTVDEAGEAVFQNLTEKAIFGFLQIDSDPTLTIAEIDQKGAEWAEKHGIAVSLQKKTPILLNEKNLTSFLK